MPNRTDVLTWLSRYEGDSPFLADVRRYYVRNDSLSPRQYAAVERNYIRLVENNQEELPEPATGADVTHIRNGVYTIDNGEQHLTYQIYTATRGNLRGKRIVKRAVSYGSYKGFGFLTHDGGLRVWQRFVGDEEANETYIVWAKKLLQILNETAITEQTGIIRLSTEAAWTVNFSTVCRVCNRRLTTPTSVESGIGPECSRRQNEDTTAADAHAPVSTDEALIEINRAAEEVRRVARERRVAELAQERAAQMELSELGTGYVR